MIKQKADATARDKLQRALETHSNLSKRGVLVLPIAHSDICGSLEVTVAGKRGTASKTLMVWLDAVSNQWVASCAGTNYYFDRISELSIVIVDISTKLSVLVNKL